MNITMSVSGELEKAIKEHPEIKWTEIARKGMFSEFDRIQKLEILGKFIEKKDFSDRDVRWMDEHDWHPVDEMKLKPEFIKEIEKRSKGPFIRVKKVSDIFKK